MSPFPQKAALRCDSTYRIISTEVVCVLASITPIEIVVDESKSVYSDTCRTSLGNEKGLRLRCDEMYITLCMWKELSKRLKGE